MYSSTQLLFHSLHLSPSTTTHQRESPYSTRSTASTADTGTSGGPPSTSTSSTTGRTGPPPASGPPPPPSASTTATGPPPPPTSGPPPLYLASAITSCRIPYITSGPTPQGQVVRLHILHLDSKLRDVVWVRVFDIDLQTRYAMFGRVEDSGWFMWRLHQFTLAKHTLAARSLQNPTHIPCLWLYALYTLLLTLDYAVFLRPESGKPPSCWMTATTKCKYSSTIDYCGVVKPLGDVLNRETW